MKREFTRMHNEYIDPERHDGPQLRKKLRGNPMTLTQEQAERLAKRDPDYRARCIRGRWVVWSNAADHAVDFDDMEHEFNQERHITSNPKYGQ